MTDAPAQQSGQASKAKVFISYSRKDITFADRLDAALKARGFEPALTHSAHLFLDDRQPELIEIDVDSPAICCSMISAMA